ncbi:uncharacterized protein L201_000608 [Kwoniella dendrophila CBS 6074]|uniref:Homeobox domain-containing protein n=1 Tax=Kwoniella dendrophila CBS 6074 TaxID=1295534 RepID=A0AAX4JK02_9TREE
MISMAWTDLRMGEEQRSARSLPGVHPSSYQSTTSPSHRRGPHLHYDTGIRPRSTYNVPYDRPDPSSPSKPLPRSLPFVSYHDEPGPSSNGSRFRAPRTDFSHSTVSPVGPPPLAPYVTADRRYYAPKPPSQWFGSDGKRIETQERPIFPPPPRPAPPHIMASPTARRPALPDHNQRPVLPSFQSRRHSQSPDASFSRPRSPPDRSAMHPSEIPKHNHQRSSFISNDDTAYDTAYRDRFPPTTSSTAINHSAYHYGEGLSRRYSNDSQTSHHSYGMQRELSGGSSISGSSQTGTPSMGLSHLYSTGGRKKKRTRALMTHMQQSGLTKLWRKTKFPTGADREKLGHEIGLTARQVQVWFQNQRQKGRKALAVNGGIPEGEDPADYEDLQKSPRSRRLSIEGDERISAWAGSTASASSASTRLLPDPPLSAGSNYYESIDPGHHSRTYASSYQDEPPPRSAVSFEGSFAYSHEEQERNFGELNNRYREQDHNRYRERPHTSYSSYTHEPSYPHLQQSSSYSTAQPPRPPSSSSYRHFSSPSSERLPPLSPHWERPFPSVLEPINRSSPNGEPPLSAPLPSALSPISTDSSSRPNTRQTEPWYPIRRRRSSPNVVSDSVKSPYPGNIEPSQTDQHRRRSGSQSGDERHRSANDAHNDEPSRPDLTKAYSHSHLPPELAKIALNGPLDSKKGQVIREGQKEGFALPGISKSVSPTIHHRERSRSIPLKRGRSEEMDIDERSIQPKPQDQDGSETNVDGLDIQMERKDSKRPISSNLRSLLH